MENDGSFYFFLLFLLSRVFFTATSHRALAWSSPATAWPSPGCGRAWQWLAASRQPTGKAALPRPSPARASPCLTPASRALPPPQPPAAGRAPLCPAPAPSYLHRCIHQEPNKISFAFLVFFYNFLCNKQDWTYTPKYEKQQNPKHHLGRGVDTPCALVARLWGAHAQSPPLTKLNQRGSVIIARETHIQVAETFINTIQPDPSSYIKVISSM